MASEELRALGLRAEARDWLRKLGVRDDQLVAPGAFWSGVAENLATFAAQESAREHERAEGLAAKLVKMKAELAVAWSDCHDGKCRACPSCCDAANARAEGLAKELAAMRATRGDAHLHKIAARQAEAVAADFQAQRDAATARVAELEKKQEDSLKDWDKDLANLRAAETELERLRALPDGLREVVKLYQREHEDNAICPSGDPTDLAYCDACRAAITLNEAAAAPFPSAQQIPGAPLDAKMEKP